MNKMLSNLVVLSLFDGISCGQVALNKVGAKFRYLASEVHPPSIRITQANFPDTEQLKDVRHIDGYRLRGIVNLLIGGSPCQCFSMAGTRKGMTTITNVEVLSLTDYLKLKSEGFKFKGQSYLFWEFVRLLKEIQPQYFLLENVRMSKKWAKIISDTLGVEPHLINSSLVSGQNRPRLYWTNIPYTPIKDKEIFLGDQVLGAICGTNTHGKLVPEHLRTRNTKGKLVKYKHIGWEDSIQNKACCLVTKRGHYRNIQGIVKGYTPEDAEALQRLPNGYTAVDGISNSERHKVIGNGWTVDVLVEAFFKNLPWASELKVQPKGKFCKL